MNQGAVGQSLDESFRVVVFIVYCKIVCAIKPIIFHDVSSLNM